MKKLIISLTLGFLGLWFLKLWYFGELDFYILPRFNILVVFTAIFLCLFSVALLFLKNKWHQVIDHIQLRSLLPFLLLIILAVFMPPKPLSSQSVMQRGVETNLSQIRLSTPINFEIDSDKRTFADWVKIISTSQNPQQYSGENAFIKGFVYRDETSKPNEFYLARFVIRCCSADARPVVLRVQSTDAPSFENDQWLKIEGTFATDTDPDQPLFLTLNKATKIEAPQTPYIY